VKRNLVDKESFMKFLIGMIFGLVVAIAVPVAMVVSGAAAQSHPRSKKSILSETNGSN
jgi:hypothetical protein